MIKQVLMATALTAGLLAPVAAQDHERISGPEIVADLHRIAAMAGDRFSLAGGQELALQIDDLSDQLEARGAAHAGEWSAAIGFHMTTTEPEADPCDTIEPVRTVSRSGVAFDGTLCLLAEDVDGASALTRDLLLQAPLDGQTLYLRSMASIQATDPDLLADGMTLLAAMSDAVVADIRFNEAVSVDGDNLVQQWAGLMDDITAQSEGYIRFPESAATAEQLAHAARELDAASDAASATWGISVNFQAVDSATNGNGQPEAAEPNPAPDTCTRLPDITLSDANGASHVWHQCVAPVPGDEEGRQAFLMIWRNTQGPSSRGWVELNLGASTDTPAFRDTVVREAGIILQMLASGAVIQPPESDN